MRRGNATAAAAAAPQLEAAPRLGRRAFLVEDNGIVLEYTTDMLEQLGFGVRAFERPWDALHAATMSMQPAVLVTDLALPEMDGLELAARFLAVWPELGVVCISGDPGRSLRIPRLLPPQTVFLRKPFDRDQLGVVIAEVLREQASAGAGARSAGRRTRT